MKQFGKIFKFELYGYLKNKIFVGITAFLVVAIAIVMFIPNIIALVKGDGEPDTDNEQAVMLIYSEDKSLTELLSLYVSEAFTEFSVKTEAERQRFCPFFPECRGVTAASFCSKKKICLKI